MTQAIEILNAAEIEALKANKIALLRESEKLRERQARRRYGTLAAQVATAGTSVIGFIALLT